MLFFEMDERMQGTEKRSQQSATSSKSESSSSPLAQPHQPSTDAWSTRQALGIPVDSNSYRVTQENLRDFSIGSNMIRHFIFNGDMLLQFRE